MPSERFANAIAAIDAANSADPTLVSVRGRQRQKELAHAELVTDWVSRLTTNPSEVLLLAARAHHIRRWEIPRSSHPSGRAGYLAWRRALHGHHAQIVTALLTAEGYDADTVGGVADLVSKRRLGRDPDAQILEDAVCLVFLETQLSDLVPRLETEKLVQILRKTLRKMSAPGIALAGDLPLDHRGRTLLARALDDSD